MAAVNHPITGAPKPSPAPADGALPLRVEVRDLQANFPDQWNLYLLALQAFQSQDEKADLSYYGIAGIHGRPYRPWGGVQGDNPDGWQGYCTHSSILFAPWHRPYLALFEQSLFQAVQNIAAQFTGADKARYQKAAATFRIPYWDWAAQPAAGDYFPSTVAAQQIGVITPQSSGKTVQISNPLYSYNFKPINPLSGDFPEQPYSSWPSTLRYPSSTSSPKAVSRENQVINAMASQFAGLQGNVNILMNDPNYKDFPAFSNHVWQNNEPGTFSSIEDIHNSVHGIVGGNMGHMSELDYSAFDPVFWLHHANVDRLFAIWQALNPTSYTIDKRDDDGTFVILADSTVTASTALAPFVDGNGSKSWTSQSVRDTLTFNYAYPETQRWNFSSDSEYQASVQAAVQQLYGGISNQFMSLAAPAAIPAEATGNGIKAASNGNRTVSGTQVGNGKPELKARNIDTASAAKPSKDDKKAASTSEVRVREIDLESEIGQPPAAPPASREGAYTEYIVNIVAPKHILHQRYVVHIFLGAFNESTDTWCTQDALVSTFVVFGKTHNTGCGKCKDDAEKKIKVTGTVNLTAALLKEFQDGDLGGLEKTNVLPWLKENLHWRVTLADGTEKNREEVPGLKVSVVTTEVRLPVGGGAPRYSGVYEVHPEVTDGRPAGLRVGEHL